MAAASVAVAAAAALSDRTRNLFPDQSMLIRELGKHIRTKALGTLESVLSLAATRPKVGALLESILDSEADKNERAKARYLLETQNEQRPRQHDWNPRVLALTNQALDTSTVKSLAPRAWLNDTAINASLYLQWLGLDVRGRVNTTVIDSLNAEGAMKLGWDRQKLQAVLEKQGCSAQCERMIIPVNMNKSHWVCVVLQLGDHTAFTYESLGEDDLHATATHLINTLGSAWTALHQKKAAAGVAWKIHSVATIKQRNGFDCGVCTLRAASMVLARHAELHNVAALAWNELTLAQTDAGWDSELERARILGALLDA